MKTVVALGMFDGIHLGHQRIIRDSLSYANRCQLPLIVTTFNPHPQQYIVPERGLKLLTTLKERKKILKDLGVKKTKVFKFNKNLQKISSEEFVLKYLMKGLHAEAVFVGYDYAFGKGRSGGILELKKLGRKYGFKVKVIKPYKIKGRIIKSSIIRKLLSFGQFKEAVNFLGHPYRLTGKVIKGRGVGNKLGFPTANLSINEHKLIPYNGVYVGKTLNKKCLVNIGSRPTFGLGKVEVETYILGFNGNLYGKTITIDLYCRLRDELQFADALRLKEQIEKDIANANGCMIY